MKPIARPILGAASTDAITALSPTWDWKASSGYYVDGAVRIGYVPTGAVNNWLYLDDVMMQTGGGVWTIAAVDAIDAENGSSADQTLFSKAASGKYEYRVWLDRSVSKWKNTVYQADGAASATAVSGVTSAIGSGAKIVAGYDGTNAWISVDGETKQTAAVGFTPGSSDAIWRIGSWPIATANLNGRADSIGWWKGTTLSQAHCTAWATGLRYQDLTGAGLPAPTEFWDCGNATTYVADYTNWDWLKGSVAGKMLVQAGSASDYPYLVRGLIAPVQSANTTTTALGYYDSSGNGYHGIQPFFRCKPGWNATAGSTGGPAFVFPVAEYYDVQSVNGRTMLSYDAGPLHAGTNTPYWRAWRVKFLSRDNPYQVTPVPGNVFGQSLGGDGNGGAVPWRAWGTQISTTPVENQLFYCSDDTASGYRVNRWALNRYADNSKANWIMDSYQGRMDGGWHNIIDIFDGTTRTVYLDGVLFQPGGTQTSDETDAMALGNQTTRVIALGQPPRGDYFGFPPTYVFTGAGYASYMLVERYAGKANATLTAAQIAAIHAQLGTTDSQVGTAWEVPAVTATHWLDAANYPGFTSHSSTIATTRVIADADAVGTIRSRVGTYLGSVNLLQSTANKKPLWKTGVINGRAVWRFDGSNDNVSASITLAQPFAIYVAGRWRSTPSSEKYLISNGSNWWVWGGATGSNKWGMNAGSNLIWTNANSTTFAIHCLVFNGANSKAYHDAVLAASGNCGTNGMSGTVQLCSYNGSSLFGDWDIGEIVIVSGATDINASEQARLKNKWGTG